MWITPGRIFYSGLSGGASLRRLGAWTIYFSLEVPFRVAFEAGAAGSTTWRQGHLAIVPPYQPHRLRTTSRHISDVLVEPETVDVSRWSESLGLGDVKATHGGVWVDSPPAVRRLLGMLREAQERLSNQSLVLPTDDDAFDRFVLDAELPRATIDPRIARALELIENAGAATLGAEVLAAEVQLSFSRFVHLFKAEVAVPLRTFRSWKRARSWLNYVTQHTSLTHIALETGYPDSAHFSRSVRQVFGMQPRDIVVGSRRLALHRCESSNEDSSQG